jgi:hypothetical protein
MNKPISQLELLPAPANAADAPAAVSIETVLARAGLAPDAIGRVVAAPGPDPDRFDWDADDSVVVAPRPGVAIYENKFGNVVIRTQNLDDPYDDNFAFVTPEGLSAVIKALKELLP